MGVVRWMRLVRGERGRRESKWMLRRTGREVKAGEKKVKNIKRRDRADKCPW